MLYAILCYNYEDVVCAWCKEEDDEVMARLAVVQERLAKQGRLGPVARLLPTTAATTLRKTQRPAAGDRRARSPRPRSSCSASTSSTAPILDEALDVARELAAANPGGAYEIRPVAAADSKPAIERQPRRERHRLDRRGADRRAPAGDRRAAALFPRPRHRRGGVPGGLPARAEDLAAERAAARSRGVADPGRPQRRDGRRAPARQAGGAARRGAISDLDDAESELAERLDGAHYRDDILRLLFICCHPELPATQQIALALRIVSGLTVKQIARAFLVGEAAMEQRITRAKARIARADVPFETPGAVERAERLAAVAAMIYLVFNEGYSARATRSRTRGTLCERGDPAGAPAAAALPARSRRSWG